MSECSSGKKLEELSSIVPWPSSLGTPVVGNVVCGTTRGDPTACRYLIHTPDEAIALLDFTGEFLITFPIINLYMVILSRFNVS